MIPTTATITTATTLIIICSFLEVSFLNHEFALRVGSDKDDFSFASFSIASIISLLQKKIRKSRSQRLNLRFFRFQRKEKRKLKILVFQGILSVFILFHISWILIV